MLQAPNPTVQLKYSSSCAPLIIWEVISAPPALETSLAKQVGPRLKGGFDSASLQLTHPVAIRECLGSVPKSQLEG